MIHKVVKEFDKYAQVSVNYNKCNRDVVSCSLIHKIGYCNEQLSTKLGLWLYDGKSRYLVCDDNLHQICLALVIIKSNEVARVVEILGCCVFKSGSKYQEDWTWRRSNSTKQNAGNFKYWVHKDLFEEQGQIQKIEEVGYKSKRKEEKRRRKLILAKNNPKLQNLKSRVIQILF